MVNRAKISKGTKGGGAKLKLFAINLYQIFQMQMNSKKKVLGVYISKFETYTRYSGVADKEQ